MAVQDIDIAADFRQHSFYCGITRFSYHTLKAFNSSGREKQWTIYVIGVSGFCFTHFVVKSAFFVSNYSLGYAVWCYNSYFHAQIGKGTDQLLNKHK